ncbi:MAG: hypothetical protein GKR98_08625 [Boseongicola sp.]|nr:MAG: hypothetical protein GKR98_08625 [Boseongicola sp.]
MTNEWILDVLVDLRTFAVKNGLSGLEKQLDQAVAVADKELASEQANAPEAAQRGLKRAGIIHRAVAEC